MTPTETAAKLRVFNDWRSGDEDIPQFDPREIGEAIDAAVEMIDRLEAAEKDRSNFILEMGKLCAQCDALCLRIKAAEKERDDANAAAAGIALQAETLQAERDALRAKIAEMEQQEPVAAQQRFQRQQEMMAVWQPWQTTELRKGRPARAVDVSGLNVEYRELYALPGAQNVPSVPDGWIQRGIAELEAIRNRHDDDTLLNDRTLIELIGKAMLAAAPEAKP